MRLMSSPLIPKRTERDDLDNSVSTQGCVDSSLLLAGCGQTLHELCLALGETPRVLEQYPPTRSGWAEFIDPIPVDIMFLDPRGANTNPQRLVEGLSAIEQDIKLILVGPFADPLLELYVDYLSLHNIRVDDIFHLPSTIKKLETTLSKTRDLSDRSRAWPVVPTWKSAIATTFHFQPQFSARNLEQTGAEALARIHHPQLGLINPLQVPELRHDQRYLDDLFWEAVDQSLHALRDWSDKGYCGTVSVNVSAATLKQADLVTRMNRKVDSYGLHPYRFILELVETGQIGNDPIMFKTLLQLSQDGYILSMDDFGQGYSSLWQLSRIPFGEIKLDHSLVSRLQWSDRAQKLVSAVIGLARQLGVNIVAEGIEEQSQLDFVRQHGCTYVQGFLFEKSSHKIS